MTEDEVSRIGAALGLALPEPYRAAMLAHPSDPTDPDAEIALLDDARAVIAFNRVAAQ